MDFIVIASEIKGWYLYLRKAMEPFRINRILSIQTIHVSWII